MTELVSAAPDILETLRPYLTPGAIVVVGTVLTIGHKVWPIAKSVVEFIRGDEAKAEKTLERDIDENRVEQARIDARREQELDGLRADLERKNEELTDQRRENQRAWLECSKSRDEADFERRSGTRYYAIGNRAYQLLLQSRHDWRNGRPPPEGDLPDFEDLTGTKRPDPPRSRDGPTNS
jgi:hypothetical protein